LPPLELELVRQAWPDLMKQLSANLKWQICQVDPVAVIGSDVLVIAAKPGYNSVDESWSTPKALKEIEKGLHKVIHRAVKIRYERSPAAEGTGAESRPAAAQPADTVTAVPMIQKIVELFEARPVQLDYDGPESTSPG
jgi:hypothetical protein